MKDWLSEKKFLMCAFVIISAIVLLYCGLMTEAIVSNLIIMAMVTFCGADAAAKIFAK